MLQRKNQHRLRRLIVPAFLIGCLAAGRSSAAMVDSNGFQLYGDFRARIESDWDSRDSGGVDRDDRTRFRVRARVGVKYTLEDTWEFGVRLRSGADASQQSPHVTVVDFDDNGTGPAEFNLDKWYAKLSGSKGLWGWAGRNSLPFWKQNELFWDDDVTPAGVALGYSKGVGENGKIGINTGYFALPEGMKDFYGSMATGQLVYSRDSGGVGFTASGGLLAMDADPVGSGTTLLGGNDMRDYEIFVGSVQVNAQAGGRGLVFGADVMDNSEDYSGEPDGDETSGWVASVKWGGTKEKGDWLLAWYYASIEKFAVNNSFSQDDWVRWGSGSQTRSSDFEGHEFRFVYDLGNDADLVARLYIVEAITSVENGSRFRLDFNKAF